MIYKLHKSVMDNLDGIVYLSVGGMGMRICRQQSGFISTYSPPRSFSCGGPTKI